MNSQADTQLNSQLAITKESCYSNGIQNHCMIPEFPQFRPLTLSDRDEVERHTSKYHPYSDFNFVSMYAWDVRGEMGLSILNNNLVVRFTDYINGQPFFSFLGDNIVDETVETLINYSSDLGFPCELKLVPEASIKGLDKTKFKAVEDPDNFDYVYDVDKLKSFEGSEYHTKRNEISKFLRHNENVETRKLDLLDTKTKSDILNLNYEWLENKKATDPFFDIKNELLAIDRFLNMNSEKLHAIGVFSGEELIAYSVNEICSNQCAIGHFYKSKRHNGDFSYLMKKSAQFLSQCNIKYLNFEQDLGIEGLRKSKNSYNPVNFLKKYLVTKINL